MSKQPFSLVRQVLQPAPAALNAEQASVVTHRGSPIIVQGGPGTGKTTVLVEAALARIQDGQNPDSILLLTYGRERASELRDAIALRTTKTMFEPLARTFHSLAFSILKMKAKGDPDPILLSGPEQESYIRELLQGDIEDGFKEWPEDLHKALTTNGFARELRDLILRASERGINADELAKLGAQEGEKYWQAAAAFWKRYLNSMVMREISAQDAKLRIDPSELVSRASIHLRNNPDLLDQLRSRFTTIMVDEFQDTNDLQYKWLKLLAGTQGAVFAVGDDDQSMYRFRGATVELFSEFPQRFQKKFKKTAQQHFLRTNYRSTQNIVAFVNKYATIDSSFQKVRVKGKPPLVSGSSLVGSPVLGMFRDSPSDLASDLAELIRKVTFGHGYDIGNSERITLGSNGAVGDIALLTFSPKEQSGDKARFPLLLKNELARGSNSIEVFNPRGQVLGSVPKIEMILGLMLLCIDNDGAIEGTLNTSREADSRV